MKAFLTQFLLEIFVVAIAMVYGSDTTLGRTFSRVVDFIWTPQGMAILKMLGYCFILLRYAQWVANFGQNISMRVRGFIILLRSLEMAEPILLLAKEV